MLSKSNRNGITEPQATSTLVETREVSVGKSAPDEETEMRAMRAEKFSGYDGLKLVNLPRPAVSDGKVLLRVTAAASRRSSIRFSPATSRSRRRR